MKKYRKYYTTHNTIRSIIFVLIVVLMVAGALTLAVNYCKGEDVLVKCWVMCKPGDYVNVRRTPSKNGMEVGRLDPGDGFMTDGSSSNGWIRCYGIGEYGEGWIYSGYVSIYEPKTVGKTYVCTSNGRVACRRYMGGPRTQWITNGSTVQVFLMTEEWAVTSRGWIRSEYLEVDPR